MEEVENMMKHIEGFVNEQRVTIISIIISLLISFVIQIRFDVDHLQRYNVVLQLIQIGVLTVIFKSIIKKYTIK